MNSGLYAFAGDSATATDAACAKRLDEPMTNVSNVYFGFSRLPPASSRRPARAAGARCRVPAAVAVLLVAPARFAPGGRPVGARRRRGAAAGRRRSRRSTARLAGAVAAARRGRRRTACGRAAAGRRGRAAAVAVVTGRRPGRGPCCGRRAGCRPVGPVRGPVAGGCRVVRAGRAIVGGACGAARPAWSAALGLGPVGAAGSRPAGAAVARARCRPAAWPSSGGRTVTATWIGRPSRRDSASVIAGRSRDSMTSRVNASGTESSAVSSTIARSRVSRRYARCCAETISSASSSVAAVQTAARSIVSATVAPPPSLVARSQRAPRPRTPDTVPRPGGCPDRCPQVIHSLCV